MRASDTAFRQAASAFRTSRFASAMIENQPLVFGRGMERRRRSVRNS